MDFFILLKGYAFMFPFQPFHSDAQVFYLAPSGYLYLFVAQINGVLCMWEKILEF